MGVLDGIDFFDFVALLIHELGLDAAARYAGLESKTYILDEGFRGEADRFIENLVKYYVDNYASSNNDQIRQHIVDKGIPSDLYKAYCGDVRFRNNKDAVYYLVRKITASLLTYEVLLYASQRAERMEQFLHHKDGFRKNGFAQLNSEKSVKETGYILLPDLGTFGDEKEIIKSTTKYEKIYLKGLIVLTADELKTRNGQTYEVRNIIPPEYSHLREYPQDGKMVIAVSPIHREWLLIDRPRIEINPSNGTREYLFECDGVTDESLIINRVKAAYKIASKYGARILLFPEMYGTESLSNYAADSIGITSDSNVPIVVMPSWWHDNLNTAPVLNEALLPVFDQAKHSSFIYTDDSKKEKYPEPSRENLKNKDHIVYLYHIPRIGRMCVCICKDFLMDTYRRMLSESLEASFMLIPAFSPEIDHFLNCMGELRRAGSHGVMVNCCAAFYAGLKTADLEQNHDVGAVTLMRPIKFGSDLSSVKLLTSSCSGKCNEANCVFIITITDDGNVWTEQILEEDS